MMPLSLPPLYSRIVAMPVTLLADVVSVMLRSLAEQFSLMKTEPTSTDPASLACTNVQPLGAFLHPASLVVPLNVNTKQFPAVGVNTPLHENETVPPLTGL
jgi:hypothetical protein